TRSYDEAGGFDAIPQTAPAVVDSRIILATENSTGGRVLVLEGTDGLGRPYRSDFLVFYPLDSEEPAAFMPVYWSGIGIQSGAERDTISAPPTPSP
ncbi:MAG: hypothetical protein ACRDIB_14295, partial [Ardenticatenaceae bacterium]